MIKELRKGDLVTLAGYLWKFSDLDQSKVYRIRDISEHPTETKFTEIWFEGERKDSYYVLTEGEVEWLVRKYND